MAADRLIGIDFGTSTSVIRVKRYENMKPLGEKLDTKEVIFGGMSNVVPTVIMKSKTNPDAVYYGYDALMSRNNMEQFHSFKVDLESRDLEIMERARALTEEFFRFMAKTYRQQSNDRHLGDADDQEHTIISYPVKWSQETKRFMIEAAEKAGFPDVRGLDEAQAAIRAVTIQNKSYFVNRGLLKKGVPATIMLIDMGAGTTDLVLCRYTFGDKPKNEILSTWPKDGRILFGGKEIDVLLQDFFRDKMDENSCELVFKRVGVEKFKAWKENVVSPALMRNDTVDEFTELDKCAELSNVVMDEYKLDRKELESCLSGYLPQLPQLINGCLRDANVKGDAVDVVIATGGHSQWYFVQEMLSGQMERFGKIDLPKVKADPSRIVSISRPQETVALGLTYEFMQEDAPIIQVPPIPAPPVSPKLVPPTPVPPKPADDLEYTPESEFVLLADGENYVISKYTGNRKVVVIPPVIRGRKVVAIGASAFRRLEQNPKLAVMTFWERIRTDEPTTLDCSTVEKVILPPTVTRIGANAFEQCLKLQNIIAPGVIRIEEGAFLKCRNLRTFIANPNVQDIGQSAFQSCKNLEIMDFGMREAVRGIVWFPKGLKMLGDDSLKGLDSIKEIMLSKSTQWKREEWRWSEMKTYHFEAFYVSDFAVFYYNY